MLRATGATLFEMFVTIGLLSILLGVSIPEFRDLSQSVAGDVTLRRLASAIQVAKTSAIIERTSVTLCPSIDGLVCGGGWHKGVLLFTDSNRSRSIEDGDTLIRYIQFPDNQGSIRFRAFQNKQYLQLSPLGTTHSQNGNFTYCPTVENMRHARQLILNRTARLRFAQDGDGDGIREDSRGRPLSCV